MISLKFFFMMATIGIITCSPTISAVESNRLVKRHLVNGEYPYAAVWVNSRSAVAYQLPSKASTSVGEYVWMEHLQVDLTRIGKANKGWVPIVAIPAWRDRKGIPAAWVPREDVSTQGNFKKVTGCWPIKHIYALLGDYEADFYFNLDGTGRADEYTDEPIPNPGNLPYEPLQVYMDKNMVKLVPTRKGYPYKVILIGGYRSENKTFYVYGSPVDRQEIFSDQELKGCGPMPRIDHDHH